MEPPSEGAEGTTIPPPVPTPEEEEVRHVLALPEHWGRQGHLTPEQQQVCDEFVKNQEAALALTKYPTESPENTALRFLRARKFDVAHAGELLAECNRRKQEGGALKYKTMQPDECANCDVAALKTFYPHTMGGFDKQGRPILWEISGAMNVTAVQTMTSKETLMAYHFWTMETKLASMFSAAAERTPADSSPPNATCAVLDFAGFGLAHLTPACVNQLKAFISVDNVCYPETLGKMLVINAPWVAVNAWGMVKGWLDPRTVAKIEIISAADSTRRLHELIDDCFIPPQYGGSGPELYFPKSHTELVSVPRSGEVVRYFEVPAGAGVVVDSYVVDGPLEVVLAVLSPSEAAKVKAQKPPLHKALASSSPGRTFLRKADLSPNSKEGIPDRLLAQFSSTELGNAAEPVVVVAAWSNAARLVGRNLAYTATVVPAV